MSASLAFNLALLVVVGALLVWFPDKLTLIPLVLSKVTPPAAQAADASPGSRPRPGARRAAPGRRPGPKGKKPPKRAKRKKTAA